MDVRRVAKVLGEHGGFGSEKLDGREGIVQEMEEY
jgi:hypothetical protein